MSTLRTLARISLGILFIFSGFVKMIDPIGSQIKFGDYFQAFHLDFLIPTALLFGVFLAVIEFVLGLCYLFNLKLKYTSWIGVAFMLFFTGLTLILAITDLVTDCGCFGDAVKLSNWETFYKNLILLPISLFVFFNRNKYKSVWKDSNAYLLILIYSFFAIFISIYSYRHLPMIDFMNYAVGSNIKEGQSFPKGKEPDKYDMTFIYQKDNKRKEFSLESLPDSTWSYIDTKTTLIKKGYTPPTQDFYITNLVGDYLTDSILEMDGYVIILNSYTLSHVTKECVNNINKLYTYCKEQNIGFVFLTASPEECIEQFQTSYAITFPIHLSDATILKSMVRSNPGILIMNNATILKKWNYNDFPSQEEIETIVSLKNISLIQKDKYKEWYLTIFVTTIYLFTILLFYYLEKKK